MVKHQNLEWIARLFKDFNYFDIFVQILSKNSCNFWKVINFLIFHYRFWQISWKIFCLRGGGLRPRTPHYSLSILIPYFPIIKKLFPARKLKNLQKICIFLEFTQSFCKFLLILMHIFEKLPRILGKKQKWQEKNLGKHHKNSLASGAPPSNPLVG